MNIASISTTSETFVGSIETDKGKQIYTYNTSVAGWLDVISMQ